MKGAIFGLKRSSEDYNAIMNYARITPPAIKENYVDIAGGDSSIDLTEAVGGVRFSDGTIEFKFTFFDRESLEVMKNEIHGKKMKIVLEREPEFYYEGRVSCYNEEQKKSLFILYVKATIKPYKYEENISIHEETVSGAEKSIIIHNSRMPVMPRITVEGNVYLYYEGTGYALRTGTYEIAEVTLYEGFNRITLSGNGKIRLEYRKGRIV